LHERIVDCRKYADALRPRRPHAFAHTLAPVPSVWRTVAHTCASCSLPMRLYSYISTLPTAAFAIRAPVARCGAHRCSHSSRGCFLCITHCEAHGAKHALRCCCSGICDRCQSVSMATQRDLWRALTKGRYAHASDTLSVAVDPVVLHRLPCL
jgi:hypothetical protein